MFKNIILLIGLINFIVIGFSFSQSLEKQQDFNLVDRVSETSPDILHSFQEMGMDPVNHVLTPFEKEIVEQAFLYLPPLHKKILIDHLHGISFLDHMPNTALTSPVPGAENEKLFFITFRSEILHQTISEWATWKENSCYIANEDSEFEVVVEAGNLNALVYILLHEASHVVDAVLGISSDSVNGQTELSATSSFTDGIWDSMNSPKEEYRNPVLDETRFRGGTIVPKSQATSIYGSLNKTPFVSLYGMASWYEDFAELATIYHLSKILHQPYEIVVKKDGIKEFSFQPLENKEVIKRIKNLDMLYMETH